MLLQQGQLSEGFKGLDCGRWEQNFGAPPIPTNAPIWHEDMEHVSHIMLRGEGGLGDEIINVRFAKNLKERSGAKIIASCSRSLMSVFSRVEGVDAVIERDREVASYFDAWVPAMSAPSVLKLEYNDLSGKPYLTSVGKVNMPGNIKVGIRWAGNPTFEHQQHRKFNGIDLINALKPFTKDVSFYSFQRDIELLDLPEGFTDLQNFLNTWENTLTFLNDMDLIITSCTSVAHAAAALGKPTWVIVPILSYYIWAMPGKGSLWYDSVQLYRQKKYGEWNFDELTRDLHMFVDTLKRGKQEKER